MWEHNNYESYKKYFLINKIQMPKLSEYITIYL